MSKADSPTATDCAARVAELEDTNRQLAGRLRIAEAFAQAPTGIAATVALCHSLTGKPVALIDRRGRVVASAPMHRTGGWAASVLEQLSALPGPGGGPSTLAPDSHSPIRHRLLTHPVTGEEELGWLIVEERGGALSGLDGVVAQLGSGRLASEFRTQQRIARVVHDARSALARQLIRGTACLADLRASAEYLGVCLEASRVLVYVLSSDDDDATSDTALATDLAKRLRTDVLQSRGNEGALMLIEVPHGAGPVEFVAQVRAAVRAAIPDLAVAGISSPAELPGLARAYREAREVAHCVTRFGDPGRRTVLTVDDLGPVRLFLANSDAHALHRYVADVLGPLLSGGQAHTDLLLTLQVWFDQGRSVRLCAARLGVHENTIRLRLARVQTITGLDVGAANDQLSLQTALLVARLQGHPALPDFETGDATPEDRCTA